MLAHASAHSNILTSDSYTTKLKANVTNKYCMSARNGLSRNPAIRRCVLIIILLIQQTKHFLNTCEMRKTKVCITVQTWQPHLEVHLPLPMATSAVTHWLEVELSQNRINPFICGAT